MTVAFNWLKLTVNDKPAKVMGRYFFNAQELCLFGVRGRVTRIHAGHSTKVDTLILERRVRHSQKPQEARERIVRMFPNVRRLELFARQAADGFDAWGNEVSCDVKLD